MFDDSNILIYLIYLFQFLILLLFNYIFFEFIESNKLSGNTYINTELVDFCVDFSLLLGLLGTLISLGTAVSKANQGEFESVISENFPAALITTILGGMIYGYCYLLRAIIFKRINNIPHE